MRLTDIKGIGEKTELLFNKLNIYNTDDLVKYYPRDYDIYEEEIYADDTDNRLIVAIKCKVVKKPTLFTARGLKIVNVFLRDEHNNEIRATWFNMPYLKNNFDIGKEFVFRGRFKREGKILVFEHPEYYTIEAYKAKLNKLNPIYRLTKGLSNQTIFKAIKQVFEDNKVQFNEYLPEEIIKKYNLISLSEAYNKLHFPIDYDDLKNARDRIAFDEFLMFILALRATNNKDFKIKNNYVIDNYDKVKEIISKLDFSLTNAQNKVLDEIFADMSSEYTMNRLIQGDVGCGKTIVAFMALISCAFKGYSGAIMAPTEVLARQHYQGFIELNNKLNLNLRIGLLTGALKSKEKKETKEAISKGEYDIVIGTHALIQEDVKFNNLALVVTDEQHRFGVNQRKTLSDKGLLPHILVMSATPIPRTLAIILYGNLDISIIDELPANRLPIKNCVVGKEYREKSYRFIEKEIKKGRQAYVICPMIEENDRFEAEDVINYSEKLKQALDKSIRIEYLHGAMKSTVKNEIMQRFADGLIDVLVSTTVIEVGINVPNATVMLVENAERFGLSALHQLRGRVGRGCEQSYCIFISTTKNTETMEKLKILGESNDGFHIASCDLKLRGPGDIFGTRQSGEFDFGLADIYVDSKALKNASDAADYIIDNNIVISFGMKEDKHIFI